MELNLLKYGNPTRSIHEWTLASNPFEDLVTKLSLTFPYSNDSFEMLRELTFLSKLGAADDASSKMPLFRSIDRDLKSFLKGVLEKIGVPWNEDVYEYVISQIAPLTARLKKQYNRARPFQIALYREVDLFPSSSASAWSASYPSGHTLNAGYFLEIIGIVFEGVKPKLYKALNMIATSREALGLHYPSDNKFSLEILKKVMKHPHTKIVIEKSAEMY